MLTNLELFRVQIQKNHLDDVLKSWIIENLGHDWNWISICFLVWLALQNVNYLLSIQFQSYIWVKFVLTSNSRGNNGGRDFEIFLFRDLNYFKDDFELIQLEQMSHFNSYFLNVFNYHFNQRSHLDFLINILGPRGPHCLFSSFRRSCNIWDLI